MKNRKLRAILAAAAFVLMAVSCGKVEDADVLMRVSVDVPEGFGTGMVRVFIFSAEDGEKRGELFLRQREGDTFVTSQKIKSGDYDFLAYNFDIPDTFIKGDGNIGTISFYTNEISQAVRSRFEGLDNETVVYSPDEVLAASFAVAGKEFRKGEVSAAAGVVTEPWTIEIKADGAEHSMLAGCILSGETTVRQLCGGRDEAGSIYFDLERGSGCLKGSFNSFGHEGTQTMIISVNNGSKILNYKKDITQQMNNAIADGSRTVRIDDAIIIPAPETESAGGQGGFNPSVGEWKSECGEIVI